MSIPMVWPDRPTCHDDDWQAERWGKSSWRDPDPTGSHVRAPEGEGYAGNPYGYPFKACSYCGSVSAEDLYRMMTDGTELRFDMADWKYGWPHKFYVIMPNPKAGQPVTISSEYGPDGITHHTDPAPATTMAKFYTRHIADIADDGTRQAFTDELARRTGVRFTLVEDGRLRWQTGAST